MARRQLSKAGTISYELLRSKLKAALGAAGWLLTGTGNTVTVFFDDPLTPAQVQAVLDAHAPAALSKSGLINFPLLQAELAAALGAGGNWYLSGTGDSARVVFDRPITAAQVQAVLDAHAPTPARAQDANAHGIIDAVDRLQLALLFDLENRVRALEKKQPVVTLAQYRAALVAQWKALNP